MAGWYRDALGDAPGVVLPSDPPDHVFHQFTVKVPANRLDAVRQALGEGEVRWIAERVRNAL